MGFDSAGKNFGTARVLGIQGEPGIGHYRLAFRVEIAVRERPQGGSARLTELVGTVSVQGKDGVPTQLGHFQPSSTPILVEAYQHSWNATELLEIELDSRRIEAVESIRLGGDITFIVALSGRVAIDGAEGKVYESQSFIVNQSTWNKVLEQFNYRRTLLLEVPLPDSSEEPKLTEALKHLQAIQNARHRGAWRDAVGLGRDVLESLSAAVGNDEVKDPEVEALFQNSKSMTKTQRLSVIRRALKLLPHAARHVDERAAHITWGRRDATLILTTLTALLQYYSEPDQ